ncbi:THO complex subunit 1-like protein, partial [Trifolium pratense]
VYCWKGLRLSARQDLEGFSKFTEYGIEGVVPPELLPPDVRSKYQAKPTDRSKRGKKEEAKNTANQVEENQVS